jgi:hypothetical protein
MPAALPVAVIIDLLAPSGRSATFNLFARTVENKIPNGLPTTNPKKIPQATKDVLARSKVSRLIATPVLAKANSGTTKKALAG